MRNWKRILAAAGTAALLVSNLGSVRQAVFATEDPTEEVRTPDETDQVETEEAAETTLDLDVLPTESAEDVPVATEGLAEGDGIVIPEGADDGTRDGTDDESTDDGSVAHAATETGSQDGGESTDGGEASEGTMQGTENAEERSATSNNSANAAEVTDATGKSAGETSTSEDGTEKGSTISNGAAEGSVGTEETPGTKSVSEEGALEGTTVIKGGEDEVSEDEEDEEAYDLKDSLTISLETKESKKHDPARNADGVYLYNLGETASTTIKISNPADYALKESDHAVVRLYMQFTDLAIDVEDADSTVTTSNISTKRPGTYTATAEDGTEYDYTVYEVEDGLYCYEIERPIDADTISLEVTSVYNDNSDDGEDASGGENEIWAVALTQEEAEELDKAAAEAREAESDDEDVDENESADMNEGASQSDNTDDEDSDRQDESVIGVADKSEHKDDITILRWVVDHPEYPAFTDEQEMSDGTVITVDAPEGAFPEGIQLALETKDASAYLDAIREFTGNDTLTADGWLAYDFDFYTDDAHHNIEPNKDIKVTFSNLDRITELADQVGTTDELVGDEAIALVDLDDAEPGQDVGADSDENTNAGIVVYHIADNKNDDAANIVSETTVSSIDLDAGTVEIETSAFSTQLLAPGGPGGGSITVEQGKTARYYHVDVRINANVTTYTLDADGNEVKVDVSGAKISKEPTVRLLSTSTVKTSGRAWTGVRAQSYRDDTSGSTGEYEYFDQTQGRQVGEYYPGDTIWIEYDLTYTDPNTKKEVTLHFADEIVMDDADNACNGRLKGDSQRGFDLVITKEIISTEVQKSTIGIHKDWADNNNGEQVRPEKISVNVTQTRTEDGVSRTYNYMMLDIYKETVSTEYSFEAIKGDEIITPHYNGDFSVYIVGLKTAEWIEDSSSEYGYKYITYSYDLSEIEIGKVVSESGADPIYGSYYYEKTEKNEHIVNITNSIMYEPLAVKKVWGSGIKYDDYKVRITLYYKYVDGDGKEHVEVYTPKSPYENPVILSKANDWQYDYGRMPVYTSDGYRITDYYVTEEVLDKSDQDITDEYDQTISDLKNLVKVSKTYLNLQKNNSLEVESNYSIVVTYHYKYKDSTGEERESTQKITLNKDNRWEYNLRYKPSNIIEESRTVQVLDGNGKDVTSQYDEDTSIIYESTKTEDVYTIDVKNTLKTKNVRLKKVDNEGKELSDAQFSLLNTVGSYKDKYYDTLTETFIDGVTDDDGKLTSPLFTIGSLDVALEEGTYVLTEEQAPPGYNKTGAKTIVVTENGITVDGVKLEESEEEQTEGSTKTTYQYYLLDIVNQLGYEMPSTGGAGTILLELGGSAALLTSMFVGYSRRRRHRKEGEM